MERKKLIKKLEKAGLICNDWDKAIPIIEKNGRNKVINELDGVYGFDLVDKVEVLCSELVA